MQFQTDSIIPRVGNLIVLLIQFELNTFFASLNLVKLAKIAEVRNLIVLLIQFEPNTFFATFFASLNLV